MNETLLIILFTVWYLIGILSFYYWFTKDCDILLNFEHISLWIAIGLFGVIAWFIGRSIHSDKEVKYRTLFKKRK